jgi:AraC-like DNA-binding protein
MPHRLRTPRKSVPAPSLTADEDLWVKPLLCIPDLLREFRVAPATVYRRAGIDPRALSDPKNRLSFSMVGRWIEECVAATGCLHFGLLVGQRAGSGAVGVIAGLFQFAPTVRAALRALVGHLHLHDRGAVLVLHSWSAREVELAYVIHHRGTPGTAQISDAALAIAADLMRGVCGQAWVPTRVMFAHERPKDIAPYRSFFKTRLGFDAARSALVFPAALLDRPLPGADTRAEAGIRALIHEIEAIESPSMTMRVRHALNVMLVAGVPSFDRIARALALSRRTLRRRLADEGTSVSQLLDQLRCERARQLLEETRMPIQEIAATLHYSKPGAFSRAYKGWAGVTPRSSRTKAVNR